MEKFLISVDLDDTLLTQEKTITDESVSYIQELERKGHHFETDNDTECVVHYMADKLSEGYKLEEALENAVEDLDGPFSLLVGTPSGIGIAKDKLGLRPGVMAENDEVFAIASEEMALQDVLETDHVEQIAPGETRSYTI